jgi:hypothetical protein
LPRAFVRHSAHMLCAESQKRALGTSDGRANGRDGRYVAPWGRSCAEDPLLQLSAQLLCVVSRWLCRETALFPLGTIRLYRGLFLCRELDPLLSAKRPCAKSFGSGSRHRAELSVEAVFPVVYSEPLGIKSYTNSETWVSRQHPNSLTILRWFIWESIATSLMNWLISPSSMIFDLFIATTRW